LNNSDFQVLLQASFQAIYSLVLSNAFQGICQTAFISLQTLFHNQLNHPLYQAFQYFIALLTVQVIAGATTFSITGTLTAHNATHLAVSVHISHNVVLFHFSNIGVDHHIAHHTIPHCTILHHSVGATLVGHTANVSHNQVIKLQAFHHVVYSVSFLILLISCAFCANSSSHHKKLHILYACSVTSCDGVVAKSSIFFQILDNIHISSYLFSLTAFIASFISISDLAIVINALLSCGVNFVVHHKSCLFSLIACNAIFSSIQLDFIFSNACLSLTNKLVGHLH